MRRVWLSLAVIVLFAVDAFAHCQKCVLAPGNCLECADTDYNGAVLCTITQNGNLCTLQGACTGPLGDECTRPPSCQQVDQPFPCAVRSPE